MREGIIKKEPIYNYRGRTYVHVGQMSDYDKRVSRIAAQIKDQELRLIHDKRMGNTDKIKAREAHLAKLQGQSTKLESGKGDFIKELKQKKSDLETHYSDDDGNVKSLYKGNYDEIVNRLNKTDESYNEFQSEGQNSYPISNGTEKDSKYGFMNQKEESKSLYSTLKNVLIEADQSTTRKMNTDGGASNNPQQKTEKDVDLSKIDIDNEEEELGYNDGELEDLTTESNDSKYEYGLNEEGMKKASNLGTDNSMYSSIGERIKKEKDSYLKALDNNTMLGNAMDIVAMGSNIVDMKHNRDEEFDSNLHLVGRSNNKVQAPNITSALNNKADANLVRGLYQSRVGGNGIVENAANVANADSMALKIGEAQGKMNSQAASQTSIAEARDKAFVEGTNSRAIIEDQRRKDAFEDKKSKYDQVGKQSLYSMASNIGTRKINKDYNTYNYLRQKSMDQAYKDALMKDGLVPNA